MTSHDENGWIATELPEWLGKNSFPEPFGVVRLAGDGSTRTFFRVVGQKKSCVLLHDKGLEFSRDYLVLQKFLSSKKIPTPKFLKEDKQAGIVLMEDLGDDLLQLRIAREKKKKQHWLAQGILVAADLHGRTFPVPGSLPVSKRKFDTEKYSSELAFTVEHLLKGLLKLKPAGPPKCIEDYCSCISRFGPLVFSHRDYHSRNILVKLEKLFIIDFQDARLGPPHYDVASYLYDPYVPITDASREELLKMYQQRVKRYPKLYSKISWDTFGTQLKWVAFQRMVKAAGSYASFYTRFGKKTHFRYLVPALNTAIKISEETPALIPVAETFRLKECLAKVKRL